MPVGAHGVFPSNLCGNLNCFDSADLLEYGSGGKKLLTDDCVHLLVGLILA